MPKLSDFFAPQRLLLIQQREIQTLQNELAALRQQNISMHEGMRRCVSCKYRIEFKRHQGLPAEPG